MNDIVYLVMHENYDDCHPLAAFTDRGKLVSWLRDRSAAGQTEFIHLYGMRDGEPAPGETYLRWELELDGLTPYWLHVQTTEVPASE